MNKVLLCAVLGLDNSHIWQIEQAQAAVNIFEWREGSLYLALLYIKYPCGKRHLSSFLLAGDRHHARLATSEVRCARTLASGIE